MQKTTFLFEILVHEDASTDNTRSILNKYELEYPNLFRCIYQTENQFKKQNVLVDVLFPIAKGKYIALCEGDDYWTDPLKLQKQVDFLEKHDDYSMCFHEADVVNSENKFLRKFNNIAKDRDFNIHDLIKRNNISTASVVFRRKNIEKMPELFNQLNAGDWGLHLINARYGKIRYMKDCMSAYRQHEGGIWASLSHSEMILKGVELMQQMDKMFDYEYHEEFTVAMEERLRNLNTTEESTELSLFRKAKQKLMFLGRIKRLFNG